MTSIKCPHCGLVQFATAETCKRCKKDVRVAADFTSVQTSTDDNQSGVRYQTDYPLVSWLITILLVIVNSFLSYAIYRKTATNGAELFGSIIGGLIAWPLILTIIYALSSNFRERYSLHAVINFGLGLNAIIQVFMSARSVV